MAETITTLGDRLRHERRARRWSQAEAAEWFGVKQPSYFRWESGQLAPAARHRAKVCEYLGIDMDELTRMIDPNYTIKTRTSLSELIDDLARRVERLEDEQEMTRKRLRQLEG